MASFGKTFIIKSTQAGQKIVEMNDADHTADGSEDCIVLTAITADRTLTLPTAAQVFDGKKITIKDESNNVSSPQREFFVVTPGTEKIDAADSITFQTAHFALTIYWRAGQWWELSRVNA